MIIEPHVQPELSCKANGLPVSQAAVLGAQASPSACASDINQDGVVDISDYSLMSGQFFQADKCSDVNLDGTTDIQDYSIMSSSFFQACI